MIRQIRLSRSIWVALSILLSSTVFAGDYLGSLSWQQARERLSDASIVILPFGAGAKEHGPHLPMNADRVVMEYLVAQAVDTRDVVAAPPVLHGWFPAFRDFPGTEVREASVFESYIREVALSLVRSGAERLLILNTGIDRATGLPITIAAREIRAGTGIPVLVVNWGDLETDAIEALAEQEMGGHADEIETSINLYLQPELVNMDAAVTDYGNRAPKDYGGYQPGVLSTNPADTGYAPSGIFGDATLATVEKGRAALDIMTTEWLKILDGFAQTPTRRTPQ